MKALASLILLCSFVLIMDSPAEDQRGPWDLVEEARRKDQPKTEIELLKQIEAAAVADQDWAQAARAMAQRLAAEAAIEGEALVIKKLDAELETAPEPVQPVLRALAAGWMHGYFLQNRWRFIERSSTGVLPPAGEKPMASDMETWDLARVLKEIDERMKQALADEAVLKGFEVEDFSALLKEGELGDAWQPTLFDFVAQRALDFYEMEEVAVSRPVDAFGFAADSPAFGSVDAFLAWRPETEDESSPKLRALQVHQGLIAFHRDDDDPRAFLLADLERLRWAREASASEGSEARFGKAIRGFIDAHDSHPVSAWARVDLGELLEKQEKNKEAHAVYAAGARLFPESPFGKLCLNGMNRLEHRELSLWTESNWTPAGEEIVVNHRNLKQIWFRLYQVPFEPGKRTINDDPLPNRAIWTSTLHAGVPALAWTRDLVDEGAFERRKTVFETPSDLQPGFYYLVASGREKFTMEDNALAVVGVHVTSLAMRAQARMEGLVEGSVVDAVTGMPLKDVEVRILAEVNDEVRDWRVTTDEDGVFQLKKKIRGRLLVVAFRGDQKVVVRTWVGGGRPPESRSYSRAVFFTDRALYRPGQVIHFKGIWCRYNHQEGEYGYLENTEGTVVLRDPNGKEVAELKVTTNERGSFSGTFTAPEGSVLGRCQIQLKQEIGAAVFRVEEYKRPKFFAEIDEPETEFALGDEVTVKVRAEAYTGAAIDGAKVSWRVTRSARFPEWMRWCWWVPPVSSGVEEIAHGNVETNGDGIAEISFVAKPDETVDRGLEPVFQYKVVADVTDGSGETRSASEMVSVAYTSLRASLQTDEWLVAGKAFEVDVTTQTHDGVGRPAKCVLKVHRLKEPEDCPRPESNQGRYGYSGGAAGAGDDPSNPDRWEPGAVVQRFEVETDEVGQQKLDVMLEAGIYRLILETQDAGGHEVKALRGIQVVDPEARDFPTMIPFHVGSPSWKVSPGEAIEVLWGSGHEEAWACVEWYQDQRLLAREWSKPGATQQVFSRRINDDQRGGLTVLVTQVTQNRLHHFTQRVSVPWDNKKLKLRWEHMVSKLEPGAKETWTAIVEGQDGEAAIAEMVATLYDASLDAYSAHHFPTISQFLRSESGWYANLRFGSERRQLHGFESFDAPTVFRVSQPFRRYRDELQIYSSQWAARQAFGGRRGAGLLGAPQRDGLAYDSFAAPAAVESATSDSSARSLGVAAKQMPGAAGAGGEAWGDPQLEQVAARKNLQETAFFFPDLVSNEDGEVRLSFTMPEALTKWRFMAMAHDEDFRSGLLHGSVVTSKDLMVQPNPPRFVREGDELEFAAQDHEPE